MCLAQVVNINPHKTVLNAQGAADDVQANVPIVMPSTWEVDLVNTKLSFNGVIVARAESARYGYFDDMLIIGFDRAEQDDGFLEEMDRFDPRHFRGLIDDGNCGDQRQQSKTEAVER